MPAAAGATAALQDVLLPLCRAEARAMHCACMRVWGGVVMRALAWGSMQVWAPPRAPAQSELAAHALRALNFWLRVSP